MIIRVKVKPNSGEERIEKVGNNKYSVSLREKAQNGKANRRLINLLAKEFDVGWRTIKIKNPKSRNKVVEIKNR